MEYDEEKGSPVDEEGGIGGHKMDGSLMKRWTLTELQDKLESTGTSIDLEELRARLKKMERLGLVKFH